jgi:hypothetical protein
MENKMAEIQLNHCYAESLTKKAFSKNISLETVRLLGS